LTGQIVHASRPPRPAQASSSTFDASPASQNPPADSFPEPSPAMRSFHRSPFASTEPNVVTSFSSYSGSKPILLLRLVRSAPPVNRRTFFRIWGAIAGYSSA
jgi:hypothetical protein